MFLNVLFRALIEINTLCYSLKVIINIYTVTARPKMNSCNANDAY